MRYSTIYFFFATVFLIIQLTHGKPQHLDDLYPIMGFWATLILWKVQEIKETLKEPVTVEIHKAGNSEF